ncbi:PQQ-binding-like beta-propeller repeat protein [Chitinophaga sp. HK235]|uniref:outer membrane protein assembly factor BamB family protein n=1 Tax=Chitinophaga sp. HK235 TaxID=2952571 RepID=UPI001BABB238|nr:PQQ-binding-like beta-propeller repeat protein [Chitinophaga sp. HK235]
MKFNIIPVLLTMLVTTAYAQTPKFGTSRVLFAAQDKIFATPVLYKQSILTASMDGHLYSINKKTGAQNWKFKAAAGIATEPAVSDATVFVGSYDGYYYAVNANSGKPIWKFKTGGERRIGAIGYWGMEPATQYMEDQYDLYLSAPATDPSSVYFGSSDSCVYALNKANGKVRWKYKTNGPVHAGVTCSNNILLAGSWDTYIYALDTRSGKLLWKFKSKDHPKEHVLEGIQAKPVVGDSTVYIGTRDARLYALDLFTGHKKWEYSAGDAWIVGAAAIAGNHVYVGTSDSFLMVDVDAATGKELNRHKGGGYIFGAPVVSGNTLSYGDFTGRLFLINTNNWQQVDHFDTPGRNQYAATNLDSLGRIRFRRLAAGANPNLYTTTLTVMDKLYQLAPFVTAPLIDGDTIYAAAADGKLYAITFR